MNFRIFGLLAIAAFSAAVAPGQSRAANLMPLVNFNGTNGGAPSAPLIADAKGNLLGTTANGGISTNCSISLGCGTVFEIINNGTRTAPSYASTPHDVGKLLRARADRLS